VKLTREERNRIMAGDYRPITRTDDSGWRKGMNYILSWSHPRGSRDADGAALPPPPRRPLHWIEVTSVRRKKRGGFTVRFDVYDKREQVLLLRAKMGYTSNPKEAVDHLEVHDDEVAKRHRAEARVRHVARQNPDELLDMQAKLLSIKLSKLQREGMKLGIDLAPELQGLLKRWQAEIVAQRHKAA